VGTQPSQPWYLSVIQLGGGILLSPNKRFLQLRLEAAFSPCSDDVKHDVSMGNSMGNPLG
jgi:hypothetical protein